MDHAPRESLRDQLARRIAQLDYQVTRGVRLASMLVTALRRSVKRDLLPRKRRLEAMLKDLDPS